MLLPKDLKKFELHLKYYNLFSLPSFFSMILYLTIIPTLNVLVHENKKL